ncbi:MAG: hypothetical protein IPK20_15960 [Betaproteobacteria bacterium]|nr:hypothetical protein [Betaproteobacteria bacterium]
MHILSGVQGSAGIDFCRRGLGFSDKGFPSLGPRHLNFQRFDHPRVRRLA